MKRYANKIAAWNRQPSYQIAAADWDVRQLATGGADDYGTRECIRDHALRALNMAAETLALESLA